MPSVQSIKADLIARAIERDPDAFAQLYRDHSARVFRHVYYLVGSVHDAEDLTSESFLCAWRFIARYEDRGLPIESWLLRIAHNLAVKHLKNRKPALSVDDVVVEARGNASPLQALEASIEAETIRTAILRLPDVQRQVIIWRFIENMSYDDVAAILGKTNGAVRVTQLRALRQLRTILEERPVIASDRDSGRSLAIASASTRGVVLDGGRVSLPVG